MARAERPPWWHWRSSGLLRIGQLFRDQLGPERKGQQLGALDMRRGIFVGLADVDQAGWIGAGELPLRLGDGDRGNGHGQLVIETGVPTFRFSKNFCAMNPGIRMQPWEAG